MIKNFIRNIKTGVISIAIVVFAAMAAMLRFFKLKTERLEKENDALQNEVEARDLANSAEHEEALSVKEDKKLIRKRKFFQEKFK